MTRICEVTGKKPTTGNTVSHAKNKTRRRFLPNLHKRRIWVPSTHTYVTLKISANGLRLIDKIGVESVLERMRKNEIAETDIARG